MGVAGILVGVALSATFGFFGIFGESGRPEVTLETVSSNADTTQQSGSSASGFQLESDSAPGDAGSAERTSQLSRDERQNIEVYDRLNEAVVNVTTETVSYNWFLEAVPREGSTGSGSIIDERGYVLTNYHVVREGASVFVTLADGQRLEASVVGTDRENDLAVIKFDPGERDLTTIPFGSSDNLRIGQKVLAIGNPFGLDRTLSDGIVSGLGRPVRTYNDLVIRDMIQTDASINPGNSGGPLLNAQGEMIGINTIILSPSGGSVGIGFAVPADTAQRVVPDLIQYGRVRRGWIEIVPRQLFPELVDYANLPVERGVLVSEVVEDGNADEAGLQGGSEDRAVRYGNTRIYLGGDIILSVDGIETDTIANLYEALEDNRPGDTLTVEYLRDGRRRETEVTLTERPERFRWE